MGNCAKCGEEKETPFRFDALGGYVCNICTNSYVMLLHGIMSGYLIALQSIRDHPGQKLNSTQALLTGNSGKTAAYRDCAAIADKAIKEAAALWEETK